MQEGGFAKVEWREGGAPGYHVQVGFQSLAASGNPLKPFTWMLFRLTGVGVLPNFLRSTQVRMAEVDPYTRGPCPNGETFSIN